MVGASQNVALNWPRTWSEAPKVAVNVPPAWVVSSYDGKYMYPESGEIIDVATRKVIGQLRVPNQPYSHSRFMVEVDFDGGKVVRATDQFGVGKVR